MLLLMDQGQVHEADICRIHHTNLQQRSSRQMISTYESRHKDQASPIRGEASTLDMATWRAVSELMLIRYSCSLAWNQVDVL